MRGAALAWLCLTASCVAPWSAAPMSRATPSPEFLRGPTPEPDNDMELAVVQGLYGTIGGSASAGYLMGGSGAFGGAVLGGAAGVGLASLSTRPHPARTQIFDAALPWLAWHGLVLEDVAATHEVGKAVLVSAPVVAPLLAYALHTSTRPTSGQVAVANSLAMWTPMAIALARGMVAARPSVVQRERFDAAGLYALLAATDVGLITGALLGREFRFDRRQVLVYDGCALGGLAAGSLAGFLAARDNDGATSQGALIGMLAATAWCVWTMPPERLARPDKR